MMDDREICSLEVRIARLEEQHKAKEKALELIAVSLADYKTTANEWRGTVQDIISKNPTRLEVQALFDRLSDKVSILEKAENKSEGKSSGVGLSWGVMVAVGMGFLGVLTVVVGIIVLFKGH